MKIFQFLSILILYITFYSCQSPQSNHSAADCLPQAVPTMENTYTALFCDAPIEIDGIANECCWSRATWDTLAYNWKGPAYSPDDFFGRYKITWNDSLLFLLVEIRDDNLNDTHYDPTSNYWEDDCLEIFIDEDHSGGNHQYNHSAFAYHVSPLMNVVDLGMARKPVLFNSHINGAILMEQSTYIWELAIRVYDEAFQEQPLHYPTVSLQKDKIMGFSLAYCDSDTSDKRENFIGSVNTKAHFDDQGWINADSFGKLVLQ